MYKCNQEKHAIEVIDSVSKLSALLILLNELDFSLHSDFVPKVDHQLPNQSLGYFKVT